MGEILRIFNLIGLLLTAALTIYMVVTFRKPRRISAWAKLLSILISLALLLFYTLVSGAALNPLVGGPVLLVGLVLGFIRGLALRFSYQEQVVVARGSWLFLLAWGGSWVIAQLFNFYGSRLMSSLGLIPVFFTTGTQLGLDGILLLRRLLANFRRPSDPQGVSSK